MDEEYPECEKMKKAHEESQAIGEFLEWLTGEKGLMLAKEHEHTDACDDTEGDRCCDMVEGRIYHYPFDIEKLLAEYFGINLVKVDNERRRMLEKLRKS